MLTSQRSENLISSQTSQSAQPEDDDESVEDIEPVLYVAKRSVSDYLEQHLEREDGAEEDVAVLEHHRQRLGLRKHRKHPL